MSENKRTIGPVTQASGMGVAIALVLSFTIQHFTGVELPTEVQAAVGLIVGWVGALVGGWVVKPGTGKRVEG